MFFDSYTEYILAQSTAVDAVWLVILSALLPRISPFAALSAALGNPAFILFRHPIFRRYPLGYRFLVGRHV